MSDDAALARDLLRDQFGRISELVAEITDGLTQGVGTYRPDPDANTINWLVWHAARIQDDHMSDLAGTEQVWTTDGWYEKSGLPFDRKAHGYGQTGADVGRVVVSAEVLRGYHAAVHRATMSYIDGITAAELTRIVDTRWDPPVTASVRIVSVIGDCLQHLGQAAYVRGLAERAGSRG